MQAGSKYEITQAKLDAMASLGPPVKLFPQVSYLLSNLVFCTPLNLPEVLFVPADAAPNQDAEGRLCCLWDSGF